MNVAKLIEIGWNVLVLAGLFLFGYGCWLAWKPAGFMLGGIAAVVIGFGGGVEQVRRKAGSRR